MSDASALSVSLLADPSRSDCETLLKNNPSLNEDFVGFDLDDATAVRGLTWKDLTTRKEAVLRDLKNLQAVARSDKFLELNPDYQDAAKPERDLDADDLARLSLKNQAVEWLDADDAKFQRDAVPALKALQRLLRTIPPQDLAPGEHLATARRLLARGLHAASQIAAMTQGQFLERMAGCDVPQHLLVRIHSKAEHRKGELMHRYLHIREHFDPHFSATRFHSR